MAKGKHWKGKQRETQDTQETQEKRKHGKREAWERQFCPSAFSQLSLGNMDITKCKERKQRETQETQETQKQETWE